MPPPGGLWNELLWMTWQSGAISDETLFDNLKAGEIIAGDRTFEDEVERIQNSTIGRTPVEEEDDVDDEEEDDEEPAFAAAE